MITRRQVIEFFKSKSDKDLTDLMQKHIQPLLDQKRLEAEISQFEENKKEGKIENVECVSVGGDPDGTYSEYRVKIRHPKKEND